MAESTPLRIVMAPKTKRAVALGLAVEAYDDYSEVRYNSVSDKDEPANPNAPGRWADNPDHHAQAVVAVARTFLGFLEEEEGD